MVSRWAPVPFMFNAPPVASMTISLASAMVHLPVTASQLAAGIAKLIVSAPAEAAAAATAARKDPAPVSEVVVTVKVAASAADPNATRQANSASDAYSDRDLADGEDGTQV